jgi:hypothetical protein
VLCFPILNRVVEHTLVLQNTVLSRGVCSAIESVLELDPTLLHHVVLDTNGLDSKGMQCLLRGFHTQSGQFKSLKIQDNIVDDACI